MILYAAQHFCITEIYDANCIQSRHCSTNLLRLPSKWTAQRSPVCYEFQGRQIESEIEWYENSKRQSRIGVNELVRRDCRIAPTIRNA